MRTDVTLRLLGGLVGATLALGMTACTTGATLSSSPTSMPVPDPSASPSAAVLGSDADDDDEQGGGQTGWRIEAENAFVATSTRVCSYEDLLTESDPEYFSILLESNGGLPDDYDPNEVYQIDINSITLDFEAGIYTAYKFEGDMTTGLGTSWETYFAPFSFERDADGVISGGSGGGPSRILNRDGNVERFDDAMTFTVSEIADPPWCGL